MSESSPGKAAFRQSYRKSPPWDIPGPQPAFVEIADRIRGRVLDAGCGTGENALYFASRNCQVVGIDFLEKPLRLAQQKATQRKLNVAWRQFNALELNACDDRFDAVLDCGLFHTFAESDQLIYVAGLQQVLNRSGLLSLLCFSDAERAGHGPRRISRERLETVFQTGWKIQEIAAVRFSVRDDLPADYFSTGGPHAWRLLAERL